MTRLFSAPLILASASPRRKELLSQICPTFDVLPADIDESALPGELPEAHVCRLAKQKALHIAKNHADALVLASDTIVVAQGQILGKPIDDQDAARILGLLSGNEHQVMTAIAVACGSRCDVECITTNVWFRMLSPQDISDYWATGEPADKAGAYGIQGLGGRFVEKIHGSYSAVVGLPLVQTERLLQRVDQQIQKN
ncbi:Maf family protein [Corallincola platygyrae]|uniref:dTTP/UTP pyrophosphatase n=1 Tax=Corallincola platygyrae TaxID=1193278 RepID=A0ABW4XRZ5_9GAMM